jgi:hypothetical protein
VVGTGLLWSCRSARLSRPPGEKGLFEGVVVPPAGLDGVVGTGLLWGVSTLCAVVPPSGLYGVVCDVSTLCAVVPPAGLDGVVGTGLLWSSR